MTVIERPFSDKRLADLLASNDANLKREIDSLSDGQLLGNSHDYLVAYFLEKYTFESLSLGDEDPSMRKQERCKISKYLHDPFDRGMYGRDYVEVDGVRVSFAYPYHGNADLFRCKASTFSLSGYPSIEVQKGYIVLKSERQIYSNADAPSGREIAAELSSQFESIRSGVEYLARDIAAYNSTLSSSIESALAKRENLSKKLTNLFTELEIPVEQKKTADGNIALRKKLRLESKPESRETNCYISDVIYEEILDIMWNDNVNTRVMQPDGEYLLVDRRGTKKLINSHRTFSDMAVSEAEKAVKRVEEISGTTEFKVHQAESNE